MCIRIYVYTHIYNVNIYIYIHTYILIYYTYTPSTSALSAHAALGGTTSAIFFFCPLIPWSSPGRRPLLCSHISIQRINIYIYVYTYTYIHTCA